MSKGLDISFWFVEELVGFFAVIVNVDLECSPCPSIGDIEVEGRTGLTSAVATAGPLDVKSGLCVTGA